MLCVVDPAHPDTALRWGFLPLGGGESPSITEPPMGTKYANDLVYALLVDELRLDPGTVADGLGLKKVEQQIFELQRRQRAQPVLAPIAADDDSALEHVVYLGTLNDSSNTTEDDPEAAGRPSLSSFEWSESKSEATADWDGKDDTDDDAEEGDSAENR